MARTSVKVEVTDLTDHDDEQMIDIPLVNRPQSLPQKETSKRVNKACSENKGPMMEHLNFLYYNNRFLSEFRIPNLDFFELHQANVWQLRCWKRECEEIQMKVLKSCFKFIDKLLSSTERKNQDFWKAQFENTQLMLTEYISKNHDLEQTVEKLRRNLSKSSHDCVI